MSASSTCGRQPVVGDAVPQHPAQGGALLVDGHLVAHEGEIVGGGEASGTAPDHGHPLASGGRRRRRRHRGGVVHREPLEAADVYRVVHHLASALLLAGVLADIGTGEGEGVVLADQPDRVLIAPRLHQGDVAGHIHMSGADRHTGHRLAQPADAAAVADVLLIVLPEALKPVEHHGRCLVADGAVGGIGNDPGSALDEIDGLQPGPLIQHILKQLFQLAQPDAAGHALAAGLGVAQAQKVQGHIYRAEPRRAGGQAAADIPVELLHNGLGVERSLDGQTVQGSLPPLRGQIHSPAGAGYKKAGPRGEAGPGMLIIAYEEPVGKKSEKFLEK